MTTQSMKDHMNRVAELPCVLCGAQPVGAPHTRRAGYATACKQLAGNSRMPILSQRKQGHSRRQIHDESEEVDGVGLAR